MLALFLTACGDRSSIVPPFDDAFIPTGITAPLSIASITYTPSGRLDRSDAAIASAKTTIGEQLRTALHQVGVANVTVPPEPTATNACKLDVWITEQVTTHPFTGNTVENHTVFVGELHIGNDLLRPKSELNFELLISSAGQAAFLHEKNRGSFAQQIARYLKGHKNIELHEAEGKKKEYEGIFNEK